MQLQVHSYLTKTQMSLKYENGLIFGFHVTTLSAFNWRFVSVPCAVFLRVSDYKMPSESKPLLTAQTEKPNHYS